MAKLRNAAHALVALVALTMAGCAVPGPPKVVLATPEADGTACYDSDRVPFYRVANTALAVDEQQAETRRNGQAMAGFGLLAQIVGGVVGGKGGAILGTVGGLATVAGVLASNVQTDQGLIFDFSTRFNTLVACRQNEARQVRADVRARRLNYAEGRERLRTLRDIMAADTDVARRVNADLARRNQTYILAAKEVDTQMAKDPAARQQHGAEVTQAKQTIQSSQRALTEQATLISRARPISVASLELFWMPAIRVST